MGGSTKTTTQENAPWKPIQGNYLEGIQGAQKLYQNGNYTPYQGSWIAPLSDTTNQYASSLGQLNQQNQNQQDAAAIARAQASGNTAAQQGIASAAADNSGVGLAEAALGNNLIKDNLSQFQTGINRVNFGDQQALYQGLIDNINNSKATSGLQTFDPTAALASSKAKLEAIAGEGGSPYLDQMITAIQNKGKAAANAAFRDVNAASNRSGMLSSSTNAAAQQEARRNVQQDMNDQIGSILQKDYSDQQARKLAAAQAEAGLDQAGAQMGLQQAQALTQALQNNDQLRANVTGNLANLGVSEQTTNADIAGRNQSNYLSALSGAQQADTSNLGNYLNAFSQNKGQNIQAQGELADLQAKAGQNLQAAGDTQQAQLQQYLSSLGQLGSYMDQYNQNVVDTNKAQYDAQLNADRQRLSDYLGALQGYNGFGNSTTTEKTSGGLGGLLGGIATMGVKKILGV